jgi:hypothetical protein
LLNDWDNIRNKVESEKGGSLASQPEVDVPLEEAVLGMGADDGEDADEDMMSETEQVNDDDASNNAIDVETSAGNNGDDDES